MQDHVGQPQQQHEVGAGGGLQVQSAVVVGHPGRGGTAGVDDDEAPVLAGVLQVLDERGHGLGGVRAQQQDGVGVVEVGHGERQAPVHPQRPVGGGRGGGHAEPAVVVDPRGPQGHPRELPQLVGLLVGQRPAAEDPHPVPAVPLLGGPELRGHPVQGRGPGHLLEDAVRPAQQRCGEPCGVGEQLRRRPALPAHPAPVGGELPGGDLRVALRRGGHRTGVQGHGALEGAVRAVGGRGAHAGGSSWGRRDGAGLRAQMWLSPISVPRRR